MRKLICFMMAAVVFAGLAAGCTPKANQTKAALKTVSMFGGNDPSASAYATLLGDFKTKTSIDVKDSSDAADETWKSTVVTDFNTGNEPDVIFYFSGEAEASALFDKTVDYETIKAAYPKYAEDIMPEALNAMKEKDGKIYAVPVKGIYEGIFCNEDMFKENNLELPTKWDHLVKAVETFRAKDIDPFAVSFAAEPHYFIEGLILSAGGIAEHSVSPTTDIATVPESWYLGLNTLKTLGDMGAFPSDAATKKHDTAVEDFVNKKAAMLVDGSWRANRIIEATRGNNVAVMAFPVMPGGKGKGSEIIMGFSTGFYITKKAWNDPEKQKAAVEFVNFMTTEDSVAKLVGDSAATPAAKIPTADESIPLVIKSGLEMCKKAGNDVDMPVDSRLKKGAWTEIWMNAGNIAAGKMTAEDVLAKAIPQNKD